MASPVPSWSPASYSAIHSANVVVPPDNVPMNFYCFFLRALRDELVIACVMRASCLDFPAMGLLLILSPTACMMGVTRFTKFDIWFSMWSVFFTNYPWSRNVTT